MIMAIKILQGETEFEKYQFKKLAALDYLVL